MLVFLANLVWSQIVRPIAAPRQPVGVRSALEWQVPTPVPAHNFAQVPTILTDPYQYGVPERAPGRRVDAP